MAKLFTTLNKRYTEFMAGDRVHQSTRSVVRHPVAANRTAFVAATSAAQPTMTPATMFSSVEPTRRNTRGEAPRVEIREQAMVSTGLCENGLPGELFEQLLQARRKNLLLLRLVLVSNVQNRMSASFLML